MAPRRWPTPPACRPGAPTAYRVAASKYTPWGHPDIDALPVATLAVRPEPGDPPGDPSAYDPATTRRPIGGTRRCPACGPVVPVPYPGDPDDPTAAGDRCPVCGYDWPGGMPCAG